MIKVLSIAGSDPSGGAGIQLDLKVFQKLGVFGMAVPAALTAQSSRGVSGTGTVGRELLKRQLDALFSDMRPDAVKTGMLLTKPAVDEVARAAVRHRIDRLVVDPVIRSSSGTMLLSSDALRAMKKDLFPLALVVTPNIPEVEVLAGRKILSGGDMDRAAGVLMDLGPRYVLIKGGHRTGPAVDTLYGGKTVLEFSTARRKGEYHGTGCAFSAALAVFIATGVPVEKAVEKAKGLVDRMLRTARPMGKGRAKYFQF